MIARLVSQTYRTAMLINVWSSVYLDTKYRHPITSFCSRQHYCERGLSSKGMDHASFYVGSSFGFPVVKNGPSSVPHPFPALQALFRLRHARLQSQSRSLSESRWYDTLRCAQAMPLLATIVAVPLQIIFSSSLSQSISMLPSPLSVTLAPSSVTVCRKTVAVFLLICICD